MASNKPLPDLNWKARREAAEKAKLELVDGHPPHMGGKPKSINEKRIAQGLPPIDLVEAEQGAPAVEVPPMPVAFDESVPPTPKPKAPPKAKWSLRDTNRPTDSRDAELAWNTNAKQINFRTSPEMIKWLNSEVTERKNKEKDFADKQALIREALCMFFEQKAIIKDPG